MIREPPANRPEPVGARTQILTVVLEDYFQVAPLKSVVQTGRWSRFEKRVEANTLKTLELLDELEIRATFFVLGWIADELPDLVHEVARHGHEIASKGYYHRSIRQLSREGFRDDLLRSRDALERAAGQTVHGYRIAHSWFGPEDLWALDVLAEEGFAYDSSVRPLSRNFAHEPWRRFEHTHRCGGRVLREFPLPTWSLAGWCLPIAGGNYFRQFPHGLMKRAVARWERRYESPFLMYFHVWELDPDQPRIGAAPLRERIRQYRNLEKMEGIVRHYLERYRFTGIAEYLGLGPTRAPEARLPTRSSGKTRSEAPQGATASLAVAPVTGEDRSSRAAPSYRQVPHPTRAVTVVVPCFNEELILPYLANTLESLRLTLPDYDLSFILVDDGSLDGTLAALDELFGQRKDCRILEHAENQGVAAAILTGIRHAETAVVCSIDCDCTYDPHQLSTLLPMLRNGVDMVTASPYHSLGEVRNVRSWRLVLSRALSLMYRLVLRRQLATYTSCFRVYRRQAVADLPVQAGGFLGVVEMLALLDLNGGLVVECPAVLEARLLGRSKMRTLRTGVGHLRLLARLASIRIRQGLRRAPASASPANGPTPPRPHLEAAEQSSTRRRET